MIKQGKEIQMLEDGDGYEKRCQALRTDLNTLAEKHGVTDAAFCGTMNSGESPLAPGAIRFYAAIIGPERIDEAALVRGAFNVGRMWQFVREQTYKALNRYEQVR